MRKVLAVSCALFLSAPLAIAEEAQTLKERLSDKASDAQRVDNCHVPPERRGTLPTTRTAAAGRVLTHDGVRALEVIRLTGKPFSSFGPGIDQFGPTAFPVQMVGVWVPRDVLNARIATRFAAMRDAGLVDEVRGLLDGPPLSRTAGQAIGYKEIIGAISGDGSLDDAIDTAVRRTRSFARRQRMWFRRDPRITWLGATDNHCAVLPAVLATWSS